MLIVLVMAGVLLAGCATAPQGPAAAAPQAVKNVIFMLTDGTGPEAWPMVRWVKGAPLAVDTMLTGAVRTYCTDSIITDSAPGATAYATGNKGSDKGISVRPWNITVAAAKADPALKYIPMATLVEGARVSGRATGVVATCNVQHATPAAFTSHWHDRGNYLEIGEQQVYQGIDVLLSGGMQYLIPKDVQGGRRDDKENLVDVLRGKGYSVITTRDELVSTTGGKFWGAFAPDSMAYDIDRAATAPKEPSLAEMTGKALEVLSGSEKGKKTGFFLFVEGSKVDWGAHADDPSGVLSDLLAFDSAVATALDFTKKNPDTLLIVVSDHGTGGITIGMAADKNYSQTDDDTLVVPMRKLKLTAEGIEKVLAGDSSADKIRAVVSEQWGISDLSDAEVKTVQDAMASKTALNNVLGPMLSRRADIGWTTGGHTGADVFMFAYGPNKPYGLMENTDVGRSMAADMGFDFESLNKRLFVEAQAGFAAAGFTAAID